MDFVQKLFGILRLCQIVVSRGYIRNGNTGFPLKACDAHNIIILVRIHGLDIQIGSRRHDPHDLPLHDSLGLLGILHLLADRHFVALLNQLVQISLQCMVGYAAHGCALLKAAVFARKSDLKLPGRRNCVLKKHFIKVSETVEKETVRIFLFGLQILLHHRCHFSHLVSRSPFRPVPLGALPPYNRSRGTLQGAPERFFQSAPLFPQNARSCCLRGGR